MVINTTLAQTSATVGTVPAFPAFIGPNNQVTNATNQVSGLNNTTSGVYTQYTQQYVDVNGNVLTPGAAASSFVRYCEYPGERIFNQVQFQVNGDLLKLCRLE